MTAEEMAGEMDETLEAMIVELSAQAIAEFAGDIGTNKEHWTQRALGLNDRFERILRPHFERHAKLREAAEKCLPYAKDNFSDISIEAWSKNAEDPRLPYPTDEMNEMQRHIDALRAALEQENRG